MNDEIQDRSLDLSDKETDSIGKKKIKPIHIIVIFILFLIQVGTVVGVIFSGKAPLDEILLYKIDTVVLDDGKMQNTYYIEWKVLNETKEGPLTWVMIGMPNSNFIIESFGEDVITASPYSISQEFVRCDLKYVYGRGQIAKIKFTVTQSAMLCNDNDNYFYEFIPGWFDEIEIKNYEFNWKKDSRIISNNADVDEGTTLTWKGSLKKGGHRVINVGYNSTAFLENQTVNYVPFVKPTSSGINFSFSSGMFFAIFAGVLIPFVIQISVLNSAVTYYRGRGFIVISSNHGDHGRGGSGGGSSGCACACAGCACACACAGGGRAGCSLKDFYSTADKTIKIADKKTETTCRHKKVL